MRSAQFQVHADTETRHWWFLARRRILLDVIAALLADPAAQSLVVDVGCGTGANTAAIGDRVRCVGLDVSGEAIAAARRRFPEVEFIRGQSPEALAGLAAEADLFVLADVLEHIEDDRRFLAELVGAAGPRAWFVITVPADPRLWTEHDVSFGHYRRYLPGSLRAVWAELPVEEIVLTPFNTRLYGLIWAIRWINRRIGRTAGRAATDFAMPPRPVNALMTWLFAAESRRLLRELATGRSRTRRGVSLLAVLRRLPDGDGQIERSRARVSANA